MTEQVHARQRMNKVKAISIIPICYLEEVDNYEQQLWYFWHFCRSVMTQTQAVSFSTSYFTLYHNAEYPQHNLNLLVN